ncbi:DEAD/DEAH box helicase [Aerococcaceae bacterium WS4759]|uniref:DEAD/DEAH box helicase n=1 Tax=Fundicoccus ignavus TaxID=2664442 RepID=A0A6I2GET5_9LACT|nr:DEAD/DEAH box helicase [Fundicoccus ignavus]MRI85756.1 DEAD/DEAH box helicase [Fundicoccus ignavus]
MITEVLKTPLKEMWEQKAFPAPTAIQNRVFEPLNKGESFIAISPTGTGKTLAYLLPILNKLEANKELQALVIAPSQELAKQIGTVAEEWAKPLGIKTQIILGGANFKRQQDALKDKPEMIIATPGRLLELASKSNKVKLHQVKTVVFDEADYIWHRDNRQAALDLQKKLMRDTNYVWFSATVSDELRQMMMESEGAIQLLHSDTDHQTLNIEHHYLLTQNRQKLTQLKRLAQVEDMQALVFFEQVNELESVASRLIHDDIKVGLLHGQLNKLERQTALKLFAEKKLTYLLTTDVASRGIDIANVPFVIHYNRVSDANTYLHRSGRTGRMGEYGQVISLVNEQEHRDLENILSEKQIELTERFVYAAQFVDATERNMLANELFEDEDVVEVKRSKAAPARNTTSAPQQAVKAKKKNRKRDTKNKGKRRTSN